MSPPCADRAFTVSCDACLPTSLCQQSYQLKPTEKESLIDRSYVGADRVWRVTPRNTAADKLHDWEILLTEMKTKEQIKYFVVMRQSV